MLPGDGTRLQNGQAPSAAYAQELAGSDEVGRRRAETVEAHKILFENSVV